MKLDAHVAEWLDSAAAWWLRELGPAGDTLVLPIAEHFATGTPHGIFDAILGLANMRDCNFELVDESDAIVADPLVNMPRPAHPKAIHAPAEDEEIPASGPFPISFNAELAADPTVLVASFARDVSHYLLYNASEEPPGGDEHRQAFVEVGAVLMGFGVFLANSAVRFRQIDSGGLHGWSTATYGELGEDALGYLLALFVELTAMDAKPALAHLSANPKAAFKWARGQLQGPWRATVERLRAITPASTMDGPYR